MQHHIVVVDVRFVVMPIPVGGAKMDFHISHPQLAVQSDFGVEKIRSGVGVVQARVNHFYHLTLVGVERSERENAVLPNVVQKLFHGVGL